MLLLKSTYYTAVIKNYRKFPDLTVTITPILPQDGFQENIKYHAKSDYAIWTPGNPMNPYRHDGIGKDIEEAEKEALKTFYQDSEYFPNEHVFITKGSDNYKNATFIDGNGHTLSYEEAKKIVTENKNF